MLEKLKNLFRCNENYYRNLLNIEKERSKIYKHGFTGMRDDYNELMTITKKIMQVLGDGKDIDTDKVLAVLSLGMTNFPSDKEITDLQNLLQAEEDVENVYID